jgi:hypothetical protein
VPLGATAIYQDHDMKLSRRTLARMMELLEVVNRTLARGRPSGLIAGRVVRTDPHEIPKYWSRKLFEEEFPEWFIAHAESMYSFDWDRILRDLDSERFFYTSSGPVADEQELPSEVYSKFAVGATFRLAALLVIGDFGRRGPALGALNIEPLVRAIEHDGFSVDERNVTLVPVEGPVSHDEEESRLEELIAQSDLRESAISKKHLKDGIEQYLDGSKDHSSLGEFRTFLQSLVDSICEEINRIGKSKVGLPGGTANRFGYLVDNGLLTPDEKAAFGAAWGFLSAGNHPGLTPRDQARIGLVLSLEFGQMLIMKWLDWKRS